MKLAVAVPSCRDWKVAFGSSLIGLTRHFSHLKHFDINLMQGASVLPRARHIAVEWANSIDATHLLCLDDDMKFSPQAVELLISRDVDVVGCNYVSKATGQSMACGLEGETLHVSSGLEEVGWIGFGVVLLRLAALNMVPAPLFETVWLEDRKDFLGEDFYFCMKVREYGLKIHVDHDASQLVSHIGDHAFSLPRNFSVIKAA
jgi:hypothetical protein